MSNRIVLILSLCLIIAVSCSQSYSVGAQGLDRATLEQIFCRFPFAQIVPLDGGQAWGLLYGDYTGRLHLLRSTSRGWKLEWRLANIGAKIVRFFHRDLDGDGVPEIIVASVDGRILVYDTIEYQNVWENLNDRFSAIATMDIEDIDNDPQPEFIILADSRLFVYDGMTKNREYISDREYIAEEIVIDNVDKDDQMEIILNTGIVIDSKFFTIDLEWNKRFGDRIMTFDMNNDGIPEIIGEMTDYSLKIFDVYAGREVW
jgi:hypothetical protein